jgi:hypothetical protein
MERITKLSLILIVMVLLLAVVGVACSYTCDFCGAYRLQTDPIQSVLFERDGRFEWVTSLAQASGSWHADGDKIAVTTNWGEFTGRIEGERFIDSGGSIWVQTTEDRSCILCCNIPRPAAKLTPTPTPIQMPIPIDYFNLGDSATSSPWLMVVSSAEKTAQYYANGPIEAPPNTVLIVVNVVVTNLGNSTLVTGANLFKLSDGFGSSYPPLQCTVLFPNQYPWYAQALAPGETASGRILYVVPNTESELSVVTSVNGTCLAWVLPW